ncbi:hypothetical protein [Streptomyces sp. NPDC017673]|uniref:hypothetical protein n=1 Tax=unclassified Streptomyces TaxID=2593676 RepID=UPI00378846F5
MITERLWLVGLGFHTERGRLVHHYYVIPHAADAELACSAALRKADTPGERAVRGGRELDNDATELRMVTIDPLGVPHLSAPYAPTPTSVLRYEASIDTREDLPARQDTMNRSHDLFITSACSA